MEQSDSFRTKHIAALQQCEQHLEEIVQTAFADLQQQVRSLTSALRSQVKAAYSLLCT